MPDETVRACAPTLNSPMPGRAPEATRPPRCVQPAASVVDRNRVHSLEALLADCQVGKQLLIVAATSGTGALDDARPRSSIRSSCPRAPTFARDVVGGSSLRISHADIHGICDVTTTFVRLRAWAAEKGAPSVTDRLY